MTKFSLQFQKIWTSGDMPKIRKMVDFLQSRGLDYVGSASFVYDCLETGQSFEDFLYGGWETTMMALDEGPMLLHKRGG